MFLLVLMVVLSANLYAKNDGHSLYKICVENEKSNIREVNSCTTLISGLSLVLVYGEISATDTISNQNNNLFNKNFKRVKEHSFCSNGVNIGLIFQQTLAFIKRKRNK